MTRLRKTTGGSPRTPKKVTKKTLRKASKKAVSKRPTKPTPQKGLDHASHHRRTRAARSSEVVHDYVEAIADLIYEGREARVVDIARRLGVTHVTVNRTVARLRRHGLVVCEPYRSIFLTDEGLALAKKVRHRHNIVLNFLRSLGINDEIARTDAEGIEHHVSDETLAAFERALRRRK